MTTLTVRVDKEVEQALTDLTANGRTRSEVVRQAVIEAARTERRSKLRDTSRRLAEDPDDVAEMRAVQSDLEPLRAW